MDSVVNLCNIALARLGDSATVASIDPPEGSAQAEHCAKFYPIARDTLLSAHPWNFATKRERLAQLSDEVKAWEYAYALPNDVLSVIDVIPANACGDYVCGSERYPQDYHQELLNGRRVIVANTAKLFVRYVAKVADAALFPPLFAEAVAWKLAGLLAGPVMKGDSGIKMAQQCEQMALQYLQGARAEDSNQRRVKPAHDVPWLRAR